MIYAETEIQLKNGCTAVVRNARPENAKQMIEYLRTVSGESPFLLREPDEVNFTVEKERAILQNKAESPNEIMLTAYVNGELAGTHKGGYVSFEFDVTALLKAGENEIAVYAAQSIAAVFPLRYMKSIATLDLDVYY